MMLSLGKNIISALVLVSVIKVVPTLATHHVIDFEDLGGFSGDAVLISDGYAGFNWNSAGGAAAVTRKSYWTSVSPQSGYATIDSSGDIAAVNGRGVPLEISKSDASLFGISGITVAAAWRDNMDIKFEGLDASNAVVASKTQNLGPVGTSTDIFFDASFQGLSKLRITTSGGTNAGLIGAGTHVALDDLVIGRLIIDDDDSKSGTGEGDPHFKGWGGNWFDFHGECDLVFVHAPYFDRGVGLDIHARTKIRYDYSLISNAVLRLGNDTTLEVAGFGDYMLNGVFEAELPAEIPGGYTITHTQPSKIEHVFALEKEGQQHILIKTFKDMVNIKFDGVRRHDFLSSVGILGSFENGEMLGRDGDTVYEDPIAFAQDWQVRDTEPMLFQSKRSPQYPQPCIMPASKSVDRRRLGATIAKAAAEKACAAHHPEGAEREACVFDVMATGDLDIAQAGVF